MNALQQPERQQTIASSQSEATPKEKDAGGLANTAVARRLLDFDIEGFDGLQILQVCQTYLQFLDRSIFWSPLSVSQIPAS
jgi:hypothetical protein